jgi:glycosyltransferase involved in cell wall biosynthesis
MKKVLIITYYWPPTGGAGVQRWLKFSKYLPQHGWEPVIYTPANPEAPAIDESLLRDIPRDLTVIRTPIWEPYRLYKKFTGQRTDEGIKAGFLSEKKKPGLPERISVWIRGNLFIPDARKYWIRPSVKFLLKYLAAHPVDAMVSSGPPHSMHLIALGLRKHTTIPWLADFRDPWTGIDFYDRLMLSPRADRRHKRLEAAVLNTADRVVTVSWNWAEDLRKLGATRTEVITNGFDPDDFPSVNKVPAPSFQLCHIGSLNRDRNPEFLWNYLGERIKSDEDFKKDLSIRFIGQTDYSVFESLGRNGLSAFAEKTNYLPHDMVLRETARARLLLLLLNNTPNVQGIIPGKLFEYLASGRPVLCIGPTGGDAARIIAETGAGITVDFGDIAALDKALTAFYQQYREGSLEASTTGIAAYSRKELAGRMARLLNELI